MSAITVDLRQRAEEALLQLIAAEGWPAATLTKTARNAGLDLADLMETAPTLFDLLESFGQRMDRAAIRTTEAEGGSQAVRDRLFDLVMARFDAMLPHRSGVRALARAARTDPGLAGFFAARLPGSMARLLDAAGVPVTGVAGCARVHAFGLLYLSVARVFLDDDSADLAATMAALDKALERAEQWARRLDRPAATDTRAAA